MNWFIHLFQISNFRKFQIIFFCAKWAPWEAVTEKIIISYFPIFFFK